MRVWIMGLITGAAGAPAEVCIPGPGPGPGGGSGTLQHPWPGSGPQKPDAGSVPTAPAASAGGGAAPSLWPPPPPNLATSTAGSRRPPAGREQEIRELTPSFKTSSLHWWSFLGTFLKARSTFSGAGCPSQPRFFSLASIRRC